MSQLSEICRVIVGYNNFGMSPFYQVFGQDLRTVTHHFICHQETSFRQGTPTQSRLTTRSRTKIEHHHRLLDILLQYLFYKHRRSLLYIVTSGMKQWVERKGRAILQIGTRRSPRNRFSFYRLGTFHPIGTDTDGCLCLKGFFKRSIGFIAKQLAGSFDECLW